MLHRLRSRVAALAVASIALGLGAPRFAYAAAQDVWVLPVRVVAPAEGAAPELAQVARRLDAVLREAVQDYGLQLVTTEPDIEASDELALTELAQNGWVVAPSLQTRGSELELRLLVVPEGSKVISLRVQQFPAADVEVRSLGVLRELLEPKLAEPDAPVPESLPTPAPSPSEPLRSEGRAVLALHATALGGYLGYSLQRASGSDDARLTYPLAALGAGVGLGSAVIVAEEWDIDVGHAWYLGAGMLWPSVAAQLLVDRDRDADDSTRQLLGIVGSAGGLTLATAGLALGDVSEGGAALTHSGAVLGLLLGGLGELAVLGDAEAKPRRGLGYGVLTGVVLSGALASQIDAPAPTDMLFIDLSALLGGLAGAALGTPFLVSQEPSRARDRLWLSSVMIGTVAGASLSYWLTQGSKRSGEAPRAAADEAETAEPGGGFSVEPTLGWMGSPLGFGVTGRF